MNARFAAFDLGEQGPCFVGGEAEDRGNQACERFGDAPECRLGAAAGGVVGGEGVEAVFQDVKIQGAEVGVHELVEGVVGAVELEGVVGGANLGVERRGAGEDVLVERLELREVVDCVSGWSEVVQVAEQEAERVAQLAVVVADALHQVFAGGDVFAEVDGGDPEADDFSAEALGDVDGIDAVAEAL